MAAALLGGLVGLADAASYVIDEQRRVDAGFGVDPRVGPYLRKHRPRQVALPVVEFGQDADDLPALRDLKAGLDGGWGQHGQSSADPVRPLLAMANVRLMDGKTDIDGLAEIVGLGVQSLQRLLRREGVTYRDMIGAARSTRAKALLRETHLSVTEIALDLGYSDPANFTRAFVRSAGCTPSTYRDRNRGPATGIAAPNAAVGRVAGFDLD